MKRRVALPGLAAVMLLALPGTSFAAQKPSNDDCLTCHGDPSLTKEEGGKSVSLYVAPGSFRNSAHGNIFACVDCHTDVKESPHEKTPEKISCAGCHSAEQTAYDSSLHGQARKKGSSAAPGCVECHGSPHQLLAVSDTRSNVNHANIARTCGTCHSQKFVMQANGHSVQPYLSYQESVHGRAVSAGSQQAAVCSDCHSSHAILSAADPKSPIFKFNVPATCGKCHAAILQQFEQSIHGQSVARGNWLAPVCTDCHGIHSIKAHTDPSSPVSTQNLAQMTCARCHEGVRLSQEFGLEGKRATTYLASYHGLASVRGSQVVANCASCHGVHNILPSSDPHSTIAPANLVQTCGQCHPGVNQRFVAAKVHIGAPLSSDMGSIAVRWVRRIYLVVIVVTIGAMLLHNFAIWRRKTVLRRRAWEQTVVRMTLNERLQHAVLLVSFFILVFTGFALKFPESWFAALLGMSEPVRRIVHRVAGTALIAAGLYHLAYLAFTPQGRRLARDILLRGKDLLDVRANLRHYLKGSDKARFGRFGYAEKIEYWALIWGTVIMAITGLMLWAKVLVADVLPRWWLDIATAVHFYEAVLATLAIVVWHFYQVFFDPDVYPMNWAWWDGRMEEHHYREEHPLDPTLPGAPPDKSTPAPAEGGKSVTPGDRLNAGSEESK